MVSYYTLTQKQQAKNVLSVERSKPRYEPITSNSKIYTY